MVVLKPGDLVRLRKEYISNDLKNRLGPNWMGLILSGDEPDNYAIILYGDRNKIRISCWCLELC